MNTKLYRPVNLDELKLIEKSNWTEFPPRLEGQPIFYPVTNQEYASQITREWNIPSFKNGFVLEFDVDTEYLSKFQIEKVGLEHHTELWVPSEELDEFNSKIFEKIKVVEGYNSDPNIIFVQVNSKFRITGRGEYVCCRILDPKFSFKTSELLSLNEMDIHPEFEIPRKLDAEGKLETNNVCFRLKDIDDKDKIAKLEILELRKR